MVEEVDYYHHPAAPINYA